MKKSKPRNTVTLSTIAKAASLSVASVSYALRGSGEVSDQTRQKVLKIAKQLGYEPNPFTSAVMQNVRRANHSGYKGTIAFIHNLRNSEELEASPFFVGHVYKGACAQANRFGFTIEAFSIIGQRMSDQKLSRILHTRGINGVIVGPMPTERPSLELDWKNLYAISIGYSLKSPCLSKVAPNLHAGILDVFTGLKQKGFKRIGFHLPHSMDQRTGSMMSSAFYWFHHENPTMRTIPMCRSGTDGDNSLLAWFDENRPEVIITAVREYLSPILQARAAQCDDLLVVTLDQYHSHSGLPHLEQNADKVGAAALDEVIALMQRNERGIPSYHRVSLIKTKACLDFNK